MTHLGRLLANRQITLRRPSTASALLAGIGVTLLALCVERRRNRRFGKGYLSGIGEGLWGSALIIATGEHGDRDAPGVLKRILVVSMWLLGVILIAN